MNSPIIYQVIFGLLFLFFCYLTYMFSRTWRWPHITVCFLLFVSTMAFCYLSARTVATHMAWKQQYRQLSDRLDRAVKLRGELRYGDITLPVQDGQSIRELQARLNQTLLDRGRVWSHCTPIQADANTITLSTVDPAATEPVPNRIDQGTVLYAFVEADLSDQFPRAPESFAAWPQVPQYYIGEFTASAVNDSQVTLTWTIPPRTNYERTILGNLSGKTVSLYGTMPVDGHRLFAADPSKKPNLSRDATEAPVFGDMDEAMIRALFEAYSGNVGDALPGMVDPYLRDGGRAAEDDAPEDVWIKVRFTQDHSEPVDSAGDPLGGVTQSESFFDGQGQANVPLVRRGGVGDALAAEFKTDDIGIFPPEDANRLIGEGVCELVERIYVRELHNYHFAFRAALQQLIRLGREQRNVERNISAITESDGRVAQQITVREQELQKVQEDLGKYQVELDKITAYAALLDRQKAERMSELSKLYQANLQLAEELKQLTERINRAASTTTAAE